MIAPSVIKFETDHFICGNTYRCVWALREYPTATEEQAILSHLGEKDGVTLRIYTRHVTPVEERKIISNAANKNRMDRSNTSDLQQTVLAESNLQDVTTIVAQMHRNREPLLHTAVYLELCAHDLEHLKLLQTEVLTELIRSKLNVDRLILRQQQGFRCVMPSGYNLFKDQFERVLPASSVANLSPISYSGKTDPHGFYIGRDKFGSNVLVDFNRRADDKTNANILILGENGTGKDVIARLLYRCSPRYGKPFVTIDLGSIPEQLFESELFGYEKGAFTDARKAKAGRMEVATGGTLFLDEIGNLSLPMQSKLLTAIEKRQISRLGSTQSVPIDVRLICATNADIRAMVDEGNFRQDLLYRINTIEIHIPPLRERGNDVILLAEFFLERYARKYKKEMHGLTREAKNKLLKYNWPGNVRELQHTIERAVILGDGSLLKPENFLFHSSVRQKKEEEVLNLELLERQAVEKAMRLSEGNITRAAEYLGITRFALYRKLEKLGL